MNLDSFLSWFVPLLVVLIFAGMFYSKMKPAFDAVFHWIGSIFRGIKDKVMETNDGAAYERVYRYD